MSHMVTAQLPLPIYSHVKAYLSKTATVAYSYSLSPSTLEGAGLSVHFFPTLPSFLHTFHTPL